MVSRRPLMLAAAVLLAFGGSFGVARAPREDYAARPPGRATPIAPSPVTVELPAIASVGLPPLKLPEARPKLDPRNHERRTPEPPVVTPTPTPIPSPPVPPTPTPATPPPNPEKTPVPTAEPPPPTPDDDWVNGN